MRVEYQVSPPRTQLITEREPLIDPHQPRQRKSTALHILMLILSAAALSLSGVLLAATTSTLADLIHISQSTAGLTILSIATTLPEKLVAYKAGRKAQAGVLIANTVGSNVFLLTLVLGVLWVSLGELPLPNPTGGDGSWVWLDLLVVLASSIVPWAVVWTNKFRKAVGVAMIIGYIAYIGTVVLR
jgi:Ca2+/Na+ antiporter